MPRCPEHSPFTYQAPYYGRCRLPPGHRGPHETRVLVRDTSGTVRTEIYQFVDPVVRPVTGAA